MKKSAFIAAAVVMALSAPAVLAVDEHHTDQKPAAATVPAPGKAGEPPVQQMKENVDKLRTQVEKISKAKDPAERQKLMQEHMQSLRAGMAMASGGMGMGGAKGADGMGPGQMGGGMMMNCPMMGGGMPGDMMMQRMQQMEKRMDMMQMLIEQARKP